MPSALVGLRSGAVYGLKTPKTRLVRIYCYGNTFMCCKKRCLRGSLYKETDSVIIFPGLEPWRGLLFFNSLFSVRFFFNLLFFFIYVFILP